MSPYRSFTKHKFKGPHVVKAWIDRRCTDCGRFISGKKVRKNNRCSECSYKHKLEYNKFYRRK